MDEISVNKLNWRYRLNQLNDPLLQNGEAAEGTSFSAIIHDVENGPAVRLTRYGKLVAVLVSAWEYESLCGRHGNLSAALKAFRQKLERENVSIGDTDLEELRGKLLLP